MKTNCMLSDPLGRSQAIPLADRVQNSGVSTKHQKVSSCKPPKLNKKAICDKILGSPTVSVKTIDSFVAESFTVMIVFKIYCAAKRAFFDVLQRNFEPQSPADGILETRGVLMRATLHTLGCKNPTESQKKLSIPPPLLSLHTRS